MRAKFAFLVLPAVLATALSLPKPAMAAFTLSATWIVTYYLDPTGAQSGTECINFFAPKHVNGIITGKWNSPTFPGWTGQWVERGQHYAWHGFYTNSGGAKIATYDTGDFVTENLTAEQSIGQFQNAKGGPVTIETGTATMMQVPSCSGMGLHRGDSPMR